MTTTNDNTPREVVLEKAGGMDVWLMPLALVACVVVVGPFLAYAFENMPREWVHERRALIAGVLTVVSGVVLVAAYALARWVVRLGHRRVRLDGDAIGVYRRTGDKCYAQAPRDDVDVEPRNYIIRARSGTYVTPVIWIEVPGHRRLTISVESPDLRWDDDVDECEWEAVFVVAPEGWHRLVEQLGLTDRLVED